MAILKHLKIDFNKNKIHNIKTLDLSKNSLLNNLYIDLKDNKIIDI